MPDIRTRCRCWPQIFRDCRLDGHIHGSATFTKLLPSVRANREEVLAALRAAYKKVS
ncbi:MAG: hypothetical protein U0587_13810 [Candidatus Binatia bacterium]